MTILGWPYPWDLEKMMQALLVEPPKFCFRDFIISIEKLQAVMSTKDKVNLHVIGV